MRVRTRKVTQISGGPTQLEPAEVVPDPAWSADWPGCVVLGVAPCGVTTATTFRCAVSAESSGPPGSSSTAGNDRGRSSVCCPGRPRRPRAGNRWMLADRRGVARRHVSGGGQLAREPARLRRGVDRPGRRHLGDGDSTGRMEVDARSGGRHRCSRSGLGTYRRLHPKVARGRRRVRRRTTTR